MRLIDADELKRKAYPFPCAIGVEYAVTIRAINEAPTVDAETVRHGRWIPCSKQMPIESPGVFKWDPSGSELLLITVRQNGKTRVNSTVRMNGKWFGFDEYDVIAWMPLPEPYNPNGAQMEEGENVEY